MKAVSTKGAGGFSLVEITIALAITVVVMTSVFVLLQRGQTTFQREPEVTFMNASARSGLDRISQDLTVAGFNTPVNMPVMWLDGGGLNPDQISIVYADPEVPVSRPKPCGAPPCDTLKSSAVLELDPTSFSDQPPNYEEAYQDGMKLFALQGPNGNPACDAIAPALFPFEVAGPPECAGSAVGGPAACGTLSLSLSPARASDLNLPPGVENDVNLDCALIGLFHVVQYRVNPAPPAANPALERRDLALGEPWSAIATSIENLQVQYAQGTAETFEDVPALAPVGNDPSSWVTRVRITVGGRSESTNLEGATPGVYAADDTHLRRSFTTTMSLRNQLSQAQQKAMELGLDSWN